MAFFFETYTGKVINNPVLISIGAVLLMLGVEAGSYVSLDSFWKFVLNKDRIRWKIMFSALVTVFFFGISFIFEGVGISP